MKQRKMRFLSFFLSAAYFMLQEQQRSLRRDRAGTPLAITHPLASGVLRSKGGFFLRPGGRPVLVAVFAFLEKVGKTGTLIELQITNRKVSVAALLFRCR